MAEAIATPAALRGRTFFGQPWALAYLAFTEAWERFSFYGMTALLPLYLAQSLLLPGHVENVAGFAQFRAAMESVFGPMTTLALGSQIFGFYTGTVYFTPLIGGWLADRFIGRRNAVMLGAILMSAGHLAMAFDQSFLLALALLIVGCGLLKGNIATQVGALYADDNSAGRTRGFAIFSTAINIGAVAGPLICGLLAQLYGWHAGFGLAGVLMLLGLATYIAGYRHLPEPAPRQAGEPKHKLTRHEWRVVAALLVVIGISIFQSISFFQEANVGQNWITAHVDLDLFGFAMPIPWFNSINALASVVWVPFLFALWRWQSRHGGEPGEMVKFAQGAFISACGNAVFAAGSFFAGTGRVPVLVPIAGFIIQGIAFIWSWPTLLGVVSRAAPARVVATMMGVVYLSLFFSNSLIGWLGGFYERLDPAAFWGLHAGIGIAGGLLALLLKRPLERILR